ncbi:hypothetical protein [Sporosarcina sp. 6E9]|uniref:hypothetical protein n=1 Tax=Sporosarcina sp. 6E9 TaxID=2819235 RepID=UPI001B30D3B9|nr:hypothetical protein [Sporosarcina sp. 6E9]
MEKKNNNGVLIFLGICILFAGGFIGSGLGDVAESVSINQSYDGESDSYRVVVQDGIIYMYDITTGQVWRKADNSDSKWEEVDDLYSD